MHHNKTIKFIIHPCDPTVGICCLTWLFGIAVHITYLISHSLSLSYNIVISFPSWCPESTCLTHPCFQGTICENLMMYCGLYQHTRVVLYYVYKMACFFSSPVGSLCHTRGIVRRPSFVVYHTSCVVCRLCPPKLPEIGYQIHIWCKCSSCSWIVSPRYWWRPLH